MKRLSVLSCAFVSAMTVGSIGCGTSGSDPGATSSGLAKLPSGDDRAQDVLRICSEPYGKQCPESVAMFPSTESLDLPGSGYTDTIPDTLDLETWAQDYYRGAIASMMPSTSITGMWVPENTYAPPFQSIFTQNTTEVVDGAKPLSYCNGQAISCFESQWVPQWPIYLQTVLRAREMFGNAVDSEQAAKQLASLRGVFAYDQMNSNGVGPNMTTPFSYSVMLLSELHRQFPQRTLIKDAGDEYTRFLRAISHTDGTYRFWYNATCASLGIGIEGNGGYYNEHFIQVSAQGYLGMGFPEWFNVAGNQDALQLSHDTIDYLANYGAGEFWTNPDPSRFSADNPPFVGHTLSYIPAYNAMLVDARARIKADPNDPVARQQVARVRDVYDYMKRRGDAGKLGHFGVSSVLGQMIEMAVRLQSFRRSYPDLIPFGAYYEDAVRWVRNQAAELRIDDSLAQAITDGASGDPRFDHVGSRVRGTFVSDNAHPMMLPTFDFQDDNDGLWLFRGLYDLWKSAVEIDNTNGNKMAMVNVDLNSSTQYMDVYNEAPYRGRIQINLRPDIGGVTILGVRLPSWAGQNITVREDRGNGFETISRWSWADRYVMINAVVPNAKYSIRYALPVQHLPITQLHGQEHWWNEANYGSYANPETPFSYNGTFIGDTLVSSDFHPTGGYPRYQRAALAALIEGDVLHEVAPPARATGRFVHDAGVGAGPGWSPNEGDAPPPPAPPVIPDYPVPYGPPTTVGVTGNAVQFADVTGDGLADLVQTSADGTVMVQINADGATFGEPNVVSRTGCTVSFADVTADGMADLVQQCANGTVLVQVNTGGLGFTLPVVVSVTGNPVLFADVTGDGLADLIQLSADQSILLQTNQGSLGFALPRTIGKTGARVTFGDVNGDGLADLVQQDDSGLVFVQINAGDAIFGSPQRLGVTGNQASFANVRGDRRAELIQMDSNGRVLVQSFD